MGVFVGDSRPDSVAAVKTALLTKFQEKADLLARLQIVEDPQVAFQLLRCCAAPRPGFWLRTMAPSLTDGAARWWDASMRESFARIVHTAPFTRNGAQWMRATLPLSFGGLGIANAHQTRFAAHYASWCSAWQPITAMFPSVVGGASAAC